MNAAERAKNHCICACISGIASVLICYFMPIINYIHTKQWIPTTQLLKNNISKTIIIIFAITFMTLCLAHLRLAVKNIIRQIKRKKKRKKMPEKKKQQTPPPKRSPNVRKPVNKTIKATTQPFYPKRARNRNKRV